MALTFEQFKKVREEGFTLEQVIEFEKNKLSKQPILTQSDIDPINTAVNMIGRVGKGAYQATPFAKRIAQLADTPMGRKIVETLSTSGALSYGLPIPLPQSKNIIPYQSTENIYNQMGQPTNFPERMSEAVGSVAPDLAMSNPFMRGAGMIPKIPGILKSAIGLGAYSGTKAKLQNQPVIPATLEGAGSGALFHGAGRLGATVLQNLPMGERIGSAIGGALAGGLTGGEEGAALGGGLGALYPSPKIVPTEGTTNFAQRAWKNIIKPGKSSYDFNKNPERALAKEGIWGKNLDQVLKNVDIRLNELNSFKENIKMDGMNVDVRVDLGKKNQVFKPIENVMKEFQKAPEPHRAEIAKIKRVLQGIFAPNGKIRQINNLTLDQAYEMRDIVKNIESELFTKQKGGALIEALTQTYHNIVEAINNSGVSPELRTVNKRIADLISAKNAVDVAIHRNPRGPISRFFPLGLLGGGYLMNNPLVMGGAGALMALQTPIGAASVAKLISKKYPPIRK